MDVDRWERIKELFDGALQRDAAERADFLIQACPDDADLRSKVESLLSGDRKAGGFLQDPVANIPFDTTGADALPPTFSPGQTISGRFNVLRFIGRGGMGEVYEARDLELRERVALKIIRPEIASDRRSLARFKQEIQLARRVTHPNVCRMHDIEQYQPEGSGGAVFFLTMELLEGETLAARLKRQGRMRSEEALPLIRQMAEGLAAAHRVGVIHRDFKPGNVMLVPEFTGATERVQSDATTQSAAPATPDSRAIPAQCQGTLRAIITDFGLAKASEAAASTHDGASSTTTTRHIIGTPAYMAPEQLEARPVTPATDVYALGLVMFEMLTGQAAFPGNPYNRLRESAPSPRASMPELAQGWEALMMRCLEADPVKRFAGAQDLVAVLSDEAPFSSVVQATPYSGDVGRPSRKSFPTGKETAAIPRRRLLALAAIAIAFSLSLLALYFRVNGWIGKPKAPAGALVLVTEVENETKDAELNGATELLHNELAQSAYFNLVSDEQIREALERRVRPASQKLDPVTAREVAWWSGASLIVSSRIAAGAPAGGGLTFGQEYTLGVTIETVTSDPTYEGKHWGKTWPASDRKELFNAVHDASRWVRKMVGEAATDIEAADRPPQYLTTDSPEALELFDKAQHLSQQDQVAEAIGLLKEAVQKDPLFAMAYMRLGDLYDAEHDFRRGYPNWQKALSIGGSRRLSLREELLVKGVFAIDRGDLQTALDTFDAYRGAYRNDSRGDFYRGYPLLMLGRTEEAIQALEAAHNKDGHSYMPLAYLPAYNLVLNRFDEAKHWSDVLLQERPGDDLVRYYEGAILFMQGQPDKALTVFRELRGSGDWYYRSLSYYLEARVLAELGDVQGALGVLKTGADEDLKAGLDTYRAAKLTASSYLHLKRGEREASRDDALSAVRLDSSLPQLMLAGSLLSQAGFVSDTQRILETGNLGSYFPISDLVRHRLQGEIFLANGNPSAALSEFQKADALDMPARDRGYLARAYLALNRTREAWAICKRTVDTPGMMWQQAEVIAPGYWGDTLCQYARLGLELNQLDGASAAASCTKLRGQSGLEPR